MLWIVSVRSGVSHCLFLLSGLVVLQVCNGKCYISVSLGIGCFEKKGGWFLWYNFGFSRPPLIGFPTRGAAGLILTSFFATTGAIANFGGYSATKQPFGMHCFHLN